jgi:hypothetical protein
MTNLRFRRRDYLSTLAMLYHEGTDSILRSLKTGNVQDAMGHVAALIDVWTNRAYATGKSPAMVMNIPGQISRWDADRAVIARKAARLDRRIKRLADAYLSGRNQGDPAAHPTANHYLNRELLEAEPKIGTGWKDWYRPEHFVARYGDPASTGKPLQHEFVASTTSYRVREPFTLSFVRGLDLARPDAAYEQIYSQFRDTYAPTASPRTLQPDSIYMQPFVGKGLMTLPPMPASPDAPAGGLPNVSDPPPTSGSQREPWYKSMFPAPAPGVQQLAPVRDRKSGTRGKRRGRAVPRVPSTAPGRRRRVWQGNLNAQPQMPTEAEPQESVLEGIMAFLRSINDIQGLMAYVSPEVNIAKMMAAAETRAAAAQHTRHYQDVGNDHRQISIEVNVHAEGLEGVAADVHRAVLGAISTKSLSTATGGMTDP